MAKIEKKDWTGKKYKTIGLRLPEEIINQAKVLRMEDPRPYKDRPTTKDIIRHWALLGSLKIRIEDIEPIRHELERANLILKIEPFDYAELLKLKLQANAMRKLKFQSRITRLEDVFIKAIEEGFKEQ